MGKIIKFILPFTLILGSFLCALGLVNINGLTIVEEHNLEILGYTWHYYTIDLFNYLKNVEGAVKNINLKYILPKLPIFPTTPSAWDVVGVLKFIAHIILYVANWLIYITNWFMVPFKILIYPINVIMSLLGITTAQENWLKIINAIYTAQVPQITYF